MWTSYLASVSHTIGFALFWLAAVGCLLAGNSVKDGGGSLVPFLVLALACAVLGSAQWW